MATMDSNQYLCDSMGSAVGVCTYRGCGEPAHSNSHEHFAKTESDGVCHVKNDAVTAPGLWNTGCGFIAATFRTCDRISESLDKEVVVVESSPDSCSI